MVKAPMSQRLSLAVGALILLAAAELPPPFSISRVPPVYPAQAARDKVEGRVDFVLTVDEGGAVVEAEILLSDPPRVFDDAVRESILKWRFTPKCKARFERPFKTRSAIVFTLIADPAFADPKLFSIEEQVEVGTPGQRIIETTGGFAIAATDPCAQAK
jgi:TonB family protein